MGTESRRNRGSMLPGRILLLVLLAVVAVGCADDYRVIRLDAGHAPAIHMESLWAGIAAEGGFDPGNAGIQRLWLEYSEAGVLLSASIQAFTYDYRFLQVGFMNYRSPDDDLVFISGGISPVSSLPSSTLPGAVEVFRAIDAVGPGAITALLGPGDSEDRYVLSGESAVLGRG